MIEQTKKVNFCFVRTLASAAAAVVALSALSVTSAGAQGIGGSSAGTTGATSSTASRAAGSSAAGAMVSSGDRKLMTDLAHGNIAEIEAGKMAPEKSQNETVKKFAQQMVDDRTGALTELQTLAQAKGVKLPEDVGATHKTMAAALKSSSGSAFDKQYMNGAGVSDHKQTIELLYKTQKESKDPELKAMAVKLLPTIRGHLKMSQEGLMAVSAKNKRRGLWPT